MAKIITVMGTDCGFLSDSEYKDIKDLISKLGKNGVDEFTVDMETINKLGFDFEDDLEVKQEEIDLPKEDVEKVIEALERSYALNNSGHSYYYVFVED